MAQPPLTMEVIKQVLRLKRDGISIRETDRMLGISRNSVKKYQALLPEETTSDEALARQVYNNDSLAHDEQRTTELHIHFKEHSEELSRTGVIRQLLWQEYLQLHPDCYSYSRYCYHLQQYHKSRDLSMHLEYSPGDMIMVDFAGKKQHYTDPDTGEVIPDAQGRAQLLLVILKVYIRKVKYPLPQNPPFSSLLQFLGD